MRSGSDTVATSLFYLLYLLYLLDLLDLLDIRYYSHAQHRVEFSG